MLVYYKVTCEPTILWFQIRDLRADDLFCFWRSSVNGYMHQVAHHHISELFSESGKSRRTEILWILSRTVWKCNSVQRKRETSLWSPVDPPWLWWQSSRKYRADFFLPRWTFSDRKTENRNLNFKGKNLRGSLWCRCFLFVDERGPSFHLVCLI